MARPSRHLPLATGAAPSFDLVARKAVLLLPKNAASIAVRVQLGCPARRTKRPAYITANERVLYADNHSDGHCSGKSLAPHYIRSRPV